MIQQNRPSRVPSPTRSLVESLEGRQMLTVTTINGTSGNDVFQLTHLNAGDQIVYNGNGGHDEFKAYTAGAGQTILGLVTLKNGNGGTYSIVDVDDRAATPYDHALKVGHGKIVGAVAGVIDYSQVKVGLLEVFANGKSASTAEVYDTAAGSKNFLELQGKWDAKVGYETGKVDSLKGPVTFTVAKGSGSVMHVDNLSDSADRTIQSSGDAVTGLAPAMIAFPGFDTVQITAGSGDKDVTVARTFGAFQFTSFDGNDKVTVGNDGRLDAIRPGLKLGNVYGTTALKIDASKETATGSYVVNPQSVAFTGGDVSFTGKSTVTLATGKGDDTVYVNGTNANPFSLSTGAGNDGVTLLGTTGAAAVDTGAGDDTLRTGGAWSGDLALFAKGLNVFGTETISLSDQGQSAGHQYAVTPTGLKRDGVQRINFTQPKSLSILAGSGGDTVDAFAAATAVSVNLDGGAGDDTLYGHRGADLLNGDDGYDVLIGAGGLDAMYGGNDNDVIKAAGDDKATTVDGGNGTGDIARVDNGIVPVRVEHVIKTVIATGNVFTDTNKNGVRDGAEKGKAGVQVWADLNSNGVYDAEDVTVVTDASGNFVMHDLWAGTSVVHVIPPYGSHQTNNGGQPITFGATPGSTKTGVNFGLHANA